VLGLRLGVGEWLRLRDDDERRRLGGRLGGGVDLGFRFGGERLGLRRHDRLRFHDRLRCGHSLEDRLGLRFHDRLRLGLSDRQRFRDRLGLGHREDLDDGLRLGLDHGLRISDRDDVRDGLGFGLRGGSDWLGLDRGGRGLDVHRLPGRRWRLERNGLRDGVDGHEPDWVGGLLGLGKLVVRSGDFEAAVDPR
jgi:hypothetical protein